MKREFWEGVEIGGAKLSKEVIDMIMSENGKDIESLKQTNKTLATELETLKPQLAAANTQIEDFKGMNIEGIKKAAEDYKTKFEQAEAKAKADLEAMQFDVALSGALTGAKAKNAKAVKALLDMEGLKFSNGEIIGLNDQIEKLKTDNDYLFESETKPPEFAKQTGGGAPISADSTLRAAMGLPPTKE